MSKIIWKNNFRKIFFFLFFFKGFFLLLKKRMLFTKENLHAQRSARGLDFYKHV